MTALEKYLAERSLISEALNLAGVAETIYNKDNIPKNLPCAILLLDSKNWKVWCASICKSIDFCPFSD